MKQFSEETRKRMSASAKARCTDQWRKAKSDRYSYDLPLDVIKEKYEGGMTISEVAAYLNTSSKAIWGAMRRAGIPRRMAVARKPRRAEQNQNWKGDAAGYQAKHLRLNKLFGRPSLCSVCGSTDPSKSYDWANLTGNYSDPADFARMCRSCHRKYDAHKYLNKKVTWAKIPVSDRQDVARRINNGESISQIAEQYGVTKSTVHYAIRRAMEA